MRWPRWPWLVGGVVGVLALGAGVVALRYPSLTKLLAQGESRRLPTPAGSPARPDQTSLLVVALDGVDRALLYELLRDGKMPQLARLLGGQQGREFPHAYLDETTLSTLPSSTLAAWATVFTGVPPAQHGVAGNEYFVRATRTLEAPAPVSVLDPSPVLKTYTEGYANKLLAVPTVYEQMKARDATFSAWVSLSQFHRGADRLLMAERSTAVDAFRALLEQVAGSDDSKVFAELDREAIETVCEQLEKRAAPRMLTVYLTGTDHYAHGAKEGPDPARRAYLPEVVDPLMGKLRGCLERRDSVANRYVTVVSDHGHTEVLHDKEHALSTDPEDDPPAVLTRAGFRLRPFKLKVDERHDFQAVLAYGGAMAYVYLADRSTCAQAGQACDWTRPARRTEDVLAAAEAFHQASEGAQGSKLKGTLDLILVRKPGVQGEPYEVYTGAGATRPLSAVMKERPHERYVAMEPRLRELVQGPQGDHAGDLLLLARNGNEADLSRRYYFAGLYRSWHGSPSRQDSEVPLIVAHPSRDRAELTARSRRALGPEGRLHELVPLWFDLLELGEAPAAAPSGSVRRE